MVIVGGEYEIIFCASSCLSSLCSEGRDTFISIAHLDMESGMSSLAEDESRSISENTKWSIQKQFRNGTYVIGTPAYGYKNVDGRMVVDEEKAGIVKRICCLCTVCEKA